MCTISLPTGKVVVRDRVPSTHAPVRRHCPITGRPAKRQAAHPTLQGKDLQARELWHSSCTITGVQWFGTAQTQIEPDP